MLYEVITVRRAYPHRILLDLVAQLFQRLLRIGFAAVVEHQRELLAAVTVRITSYNVCYTKLLR